MQDDHFIYFAPKSVKKTTNHMFDLILHSSLFAQLHVTYNLSYRHILASLHFNENVKRETQTDKNGKPYYQVSYPKFKLGEEVVREVAVPPTYGRLCNCASTLSAGLPFWNFLNYSFTYRIAYNVLVLCNHWIKKKRNYK